MNDHKGDFDSDIFSELLTRKDLAHLLLDDINSLMAQIEKEFPDIAKVYPIGHTW